MQNSYLSAWRPISITQTQKTLGNLKVYVYIHKMYKYTYTLKFILIFPREKLLIKKCVYQDTFSILNFDAKNKKCRFWSPAVQVNF